METMLTTAGFQDVESRMLSLPMCGWPTGIVPRQPLVPRRLVASADLEHTDERERGIGNTNRDNVQQLLSSMAIYPFTEFLG